MAFLFCVCVCLVVAFCADGEFPKGGWKKLSSDDHFLRYQPVYARVSLLANALKCHQ